MIKSLGALLIFCFQTLLLTAQDQQATEKVTVVGRMKDVMWKGQLYGNINLDTIIDKKQLYGLGPVEYLTGEIMIVDGRCFVSKVETDTSMRVEETFAVKAPFFGYTTIDQWKPQSLPDSVQSIRQLEDHIQRIVPPERRPVIFKLTGKVENAVVHVVNLPRGSKVSSPAEAHQGQVNYPVQDQEVEIVGFFSTEHKTIFTHHETFLHMHLMTDDRKKMGHLDEAQFKKGAMTLYLPIE
ncbi:MAG: acetolactate decarboxylase [Bacteroidota bacterium]